jgi:hypothetical protein
MATTNLSTRGAKGSSLVTGSSLTNEGTSSGASDLARVRWGYFTDGTDSGPVVWLDADDSKMVEEEYHSYLAKTYEGHLVYHCFGDSGSACINFGAGQWGRTWCSSAKCMLTHKTRTPIVPEDHLTFVLKRQVY